MRDPSKSPRVASNETRVRRTRVLVLVLRMLFCVLLVTVVLLRDDSEYRSRNQSSGQTVCCRFISLASPSQWFLTFSLPPHPVVIVMFFKLHGILHWQIGRNTSPFKNFPCCRARKDSHPPWTLVNASWGGGLPLLRNTALYASCYRCAAERRLSVFVMKPVGWPNSVLYVYLLSIPPGLNPNPPS